MLFGSPFGAHSHWASSSLSLLFIVFSGGLNASASHNFEGIKKQGCSIRSFAQEDDSEVERLLCVCDVNYCDTLQFEWPLLDDVLIVRTSAKGLRFHKTVVKGGRKGFDHKVEVHTDIEIDVDTSEKYQEIFGFGGAMSDAASINIQSLNYPLNSTLLRDYFGNAGLEYNYIRLPLGGADFSVRPYSYDDDLDANQETDFDMSKFSLQFEDEQLKIPLIKAAIAEAGLRQVRVVASAWTAPKWMKTNNDYVKGTLKGRPGGPYYKAYAKYLIRAYEEYKKRGIKFWGLTIQNEPIHPLNPTVNFSSMLLKPEDQRDFIKSDLGPALALNNLGPTHLQLLVLDDNLILAEHYLKILLADKEVYNYTTGIAIHWYYNWLVPHHILTNIKRHYPDKYILSTEACEGYMVGRDTPVELGSWVRGATYAIDIIKDLNFHVNGWIDWNLALDTRGGPNWASNFVDALIIVNAKAQEYYKNPGYYTMAHISKFLPRGSRIISTRMRGQGAYTQLYDDSILTLAALTPSNHLVIIILNNLAKSKNVVISVDGRYKVSLDIHAGSITTVSTPNWWR